MEIVTKEVYRKYLETRLKDMDKMLDITQDVQRQLEICNHTDYLMQQLYLLDNETEESL